MCWAIAPGFDSGLVSEEQERQNLARLGQTLEAFGRVEAVELSEFRLQFGGYRQIDGALAIHGRDSENDGDRMPVRGTANSFSWQIGKRDPRA